MTLLVHCFSVSGILSDVATRVGNFRQRPTDLRWYVDAKNFGRQSGI